MPRSVLLTVAGCLLLATLSAPAALAGPAPLTPAQVSMAAPAAVLASPDGNQGDRDGANRNADREGADGEGSGREGANRGGGNNDGVQQGPDIPRREQEAEQTLSQNKAIVGVLAAGLLVIVFFGRRQRNRYRRKVKNLKNAKG